MPKALRVAASLALLLGGVGLAAWWVSAPRLSLSGYAPAGETRLGGGFRLIAHDGRVVTDTTFLGKWVLLYFGFTRCTDACPITLGRLTSALDRLGPAADQVQPLFISVDPEHDRPAVLAEFLRAFDPRILGLTGTPDEVARAAKAYRVYYRRTGARELASLDHTDIVYVVGPEGRFVTHFAGQADTDALVARLRRLLSSPLGRGR